MTATAIWKRFQHWFAFLTWKFAATKIFEGIFQAMGAIAVYVLVIWVVISGFIGQSEFKNAIVLKTGGLVNPNSETAAPSGMS